MKSLFRRREAGEIAVFHQFQRPPYGGGNQFLLALRSELEGRGHRVVVNRITPRTQASLFNSFNFDFNELRRQRRSSCRMVHRVDGPVGAYRGEDDGIDRRILAINRELADVTVFQSRYSLAAHRAEGLEFKSPRVIMNASDPRIFHIAAKPAARAGRKIRIIASSWSSNPNKGAATYEWLDRHLDWSRYDFTFVGCTGADFERIRMHRPVGSQALADLLRAHDIYVTASLNDPCSNALIEALACGLPSLYADSGGHPEIVGEAGFAFRSAEEIPTLLERLVMEYEERRTRIVLPPLAAVADRYLSAMGLDADRA